MNLTAQNLDELCNLANKAAKAAGEIIETAMHKPVETLNKTGGESLASQVVTEIDLKAQQRILAILAESIKKYDLALLTEETEDDGSRLEKDFFWCIDPLDGTLPFIEKNPGFAVSIALLDKSGKPIIGVVYDPTEKKLYSAVKGKGVYRNKTKWTLSSDVSNNLTFIHDRSFLTHPDYKVTLVGLKKLVTKHGFKELKIIYTGGAVLNALWVLQQAPACYFKFPKNKPGGGSLWDYAATALIFEELGSPVSDMYRKPLDLNRANSTFLNHRGVLFASTFQLSVDISHLFHSIK